MLGFPAHLYFCAYFQSQHLSESDEESEEEADIEDADYYGVQPSLPSAAGRAGAGVRSGTSSFYAAPVPSAKRKAEGECEFLVLRCV